LFLASIVVLSAIALGLYIYDITQGQFDHKLLSDSVRFSALFGIGATFYVCREWIILSPTIFVVLLALLGLTIKFPFWHKAVIYPILAYVLFYMAYIPKGYLLRFNQLGDYSYGVYIFAYPIQQSVFHWFPEVSTFALFASSFLASLFFAIFSWHLLESKALLLAKPSQAKLI